MLYIKDVHDPYVNDRYFGVPTRLEEIDGTIVTDNALNYLTAHNRVIAACVIKCSLARAYNPNKDFNNNAALNVPVSTTPYLTVAASATTPHSDCLTNEKLVGNRLLMSNASYNGGTEIKPCGNALLTSNVVRKHLDDLVPILAGNVKNYAGIEGNFQMFKADERFIKPAAENYDTERLVFVDDYNTPYDSQPIYLVDFRAFSAISIDGMASDHFDNPRLHRSYAFRRVAVTGPDGTARYEMQEELS